MLSHVPGQRKAWTLARSQNPKVVVCGPFLSSRPRSVLVTHQLTIVPNQIRLRCSEAARRSARADRVPGPLSFALVGDDRLQLTDMHCICIIITWRLSSTRRRRDPTCASIASALLTRNSLSMMSARSLSHSRDQSVSRASLPWAWTH